MNASPLRRLGLSLALGVCSTAAAAAQQSSSGAASPPKRGHHAMVYDEARGRVLLVGGSTPTNGGQSFEFFEDLWSFDGTRWTNLGPSGARRSGQAVAYDSKRQRVLSFGGYCNCRMADNGRYTDLLQLVDDRWKALDSMPSRPTTDAGMVYDSRRDRLVLFGGAGREQSQTFGDTWDYDGSAWSRRDSIGPRARTGFSMAYDEKRARTLVFGGFLDDPRAPVGDLWAYDGSSWTQISTDGPSRHSAGIAYDSRKGLVIVFGGVNANGFMGDTWSWDGSVWKKLSETGPEPRAMGYLAYDKRRDRVVLFGGRKGYPNGDLNDTWEWDGNRWLRVPAPEK